MSREGKVESLVFKVLLTLRRHNQSVKQKITMVNYQNSQSLNSKKLNIAELVRISLISQLQYPINQIKIKVHY